MTGTVDPAIEVETDKEDPSITYLKQEEPIPAIEDQEPAQSDDRSRQAEEMNIDYTDVPPPFGASPNVAIYQSTSGTIAHGLALPELPSPSPMHQTGLSNTNSLPGIPSIPPQPSNQERFRVTRRLGEDSQGRSFVVGAT